MFSRYERWAFYLQYIPATIITFWYVYSKWTVRAYRLATTAFFLLPLLLMSLTTDPDTTRQVTYHDFTAGFTSGNLYSELAYNPRQGECGTVYTHEDYRIEYRLAGIGYMNKIERGKRATTTGINLYGGPEREFNLTRGFSKTYMIAGINPYIDYDASWIGLGAGLHAGNLRWIPFSRIDKAEYDAGTRFSPFMPQGYLRIGRRDLIDLEFDYFKEFPVAFPTGQVNFSIGSAFGMKPDYGLRLGLDNSNSYYVSAKGLISDQIGFYGTFHFRSRYDGYEVMKWNPPRFALGIHYRLNSVMQEE